MMENMKKRTWRKRIWLTMVALIVLATAGIFVFARLQPLKWKEAMAQLSGVPLPPAGWIKYDGSAYGFSLYYPPDWQVSTGTLGGDPPSVVFGNPLTGTTTYALRVSIAKNDSKFSSAAYVEDMLARAKAQDEASAVVGPAPQVSAQFASATAFAVDNNQEYELDNVFEFDHNAEQIYAAHGAQIFVFDFPVADQNPNIASSTANNAIAHEIVGTLEFAK